MAARGDEVSGRIEASIRESIEKVVAEIRSSVEDVRVAVDQQLEAALQSVQADVNALSFGGVIRRGIADLEEELEAAVVPPPPVEPPPAPVVIADSSKTKRAIQAVEGCRTQVDILNAMLDQCLEFGSRAALLILKGDSFSGWKGVGFAAHGDSDESIKRFSATASSIEELGRLLREEKVGGIAGAGLSKALGVSEALSGVLVPMLIKDRISAVVYVDSVAGEGDRFDPSSIELLVFTTGLLVDTLAIRKKIPSPSLTESPSFSLFVEERHEAGFVIEKPAAPVIPVVVAAPPPPPPPPAPAPPPPPAPAEPDYWQAPTIADETIAISRAPGFGASPKIEPAASAYSTTMIPALGAPVAPPPPKAPEGEEGKVSTQYVPPPGLGRGGAFGGPQNEEARKHEEARRFARLLVSEIKLYNESKVEQGRKNRDLYERLKEDIDRSRQMFDERVPEEIRKVSNYFYDELVRILADGNEDAMGL